MVWQFEVPGAQTVTLTKGTLRVPPLRPPSMTMGTVLATGVTESVVELAALPPGPVQFIPY